MTLTLTGTTVAADAISGTVVGKFNVTGVRFQGHRLDYFLIVTQTGGDLLVTTWDGLATPGTATVTAKAPGNPPTSFTITILPAATALPTPKSVNLSPASASLPDDSAAGLSLSTASITMSDGSTFAGQLTIQPNSMVELSGTRLLLSRALTRADDGAHSVVVTATQTGGAANGSFAVTVTPTVPPPAATVTVNGSSFATSVAPGATIVATVANGPGDPSDWLGVYALGTQSGPGDPASWKWLSNDANGPSIPPPPGVTSGTVHLMVPTAAGQYEVRFFLNNGFTATARSATLTVAPAAPVPSSVTLTPAVVSLADTSASGTTVSSVAVKMSDGSAFAGQLAITANAIVGLSAGKVILTRALTAADDGAHTVTVTATQGAATSSAALTLTVAPATATPTISGLTFVASTPGPTGAPTIEDSAPAGAVVGTVKAVMSDGSPFAGSLALSGAGAGLYAVSGMEVVTARALTPADDGTLNVSITASQGSASAMVRMI